LMKDKVFLIFMILFLNRMILFRTVSAVLHNYSSYRILMY
jgi:hypothetical protein